MSQGSAGSRVYVLVHALPGDSRQMLLVADALAHSGEVLMVDQPDCGKSADEHSLDPDVVVSDLRRVLANVAPTPTTLVGFSFGAWAAARLASQSPPAHLEKVVLLGGFARLTEEHGTRYDALSAGLESGQVDTAQLVDVASGLYFPSGCSEQTRAHLHELLGEGPRARIVRALRRAQGCAEPSRAVRAYDVPTVLLHGARDAAIPLALAKELARLGTKASLRVLDTDSHYLPYSHAAECAEAARS